MTIYQAAAIDLATRDNHGRPGLVRILEAAAKKPKTDHEKGVEAARKRREAEERSAKAAERRAARERRAEENERLAQAAHQRRVEREQAASAKHEARKAKADASRKVAVPDGKRERQHIVATGGGGPRSRRLAGAGVAPTPSPSTGGGGWSEALHPRDRRGRFARKIGGLLARLDAPTGKRADPRTSADVARLMGRALSGKNAKRALVAGAVAGAAYGATELTPGRRAQRDYVWLIKYDRPSRLEFHKTGRAITRSGHTIDPGAEVRMWPRGGTATYVGPQYRPAGDNYTTTGRAVIRHGDGTYSAVGMSALSRPTGKRGDPASSLDEARGQTVPLFWRSKQTTGSKAAAKHVWNRQVKRRLAYEIENEARNWESEAHGPVSHVAGRIAKRAVAQSTSKTLNRKRRAHKRPMHHKKIASSLPARDTAFRPHLVGDNPPAAGSIRRHYALGAERAMTARLTSGEQALRRRGGNASQNNAARAMAKRVDVMYPDRTRRKGKKRKVRESHSHWRWVERDHPRDGRGRFASSGWYRANDSASRWRHGMSKHSRAERWASHEARQAELRWVYRNARREYIRKYKNERDLDRFASEVTSVVQGAYARRAARKSGDIRSGLADAAAQGFDLRNPDDLARWKARRGRGVRESLRLIEAALRRPGPTRPLSDSAAAAIKTAQSAPRSQVGAIGKRPAKPARPMVAWRVRGKQPAPVKESFNSRLHPRDKLGRFARVMGRAARSGAKYTARETGAVGFQFARGMASGLLMGGAVEYAGRRGVRGASLVSGVGAALSTKSALRASGLRSRAFHAGRAVGLAGPALYRHRRKARVIDALGRVVSGRPLLTESAGFSERLHPRDEDGKFAPKMGVPRHELATTHHALPVPNRGGASRLRRVLRSRKVRAVVDNVKRNAVDIGLQSAMWGIGIGVPALVLGGSAARGNSWRALAKSVAKETALAAPRAVGLELGAYAAMKGAEAWDLHERAKMARTKRERDRLRKKFARSAALSVAAGSAAFTTVGVATGEISLDRIRKNRRELAAQRREQRRAERNAATAAEREHRNKRRTPRRHN